MRWDELFSDLEAQGDAELRLRAEGEIAERSRYEFGLLTLGDRLDAVLGGVVEVMLLGGHTIKGVVKARGLNWVLLSSVLQSKEVVVALDAAVTIAGLSGAGVPAEPDDVGAPSLGLRHLLRGLCRDRAVVELRLVDGAVLGGTIDRVARDHIELAVHPTDVVRRAGAVVRWVNIATQSVACVSVEQ